MKKRGRRVNKRTHRIDYLKTWIGDVEGDEVVEPVVIPKWEKEPAVV